MTLKRLIELLELAREKKGEDIEVVLQYDDDKNHHEIQIEDEDIFITTHHGTKQNISIGKVNPKLWKED